MAENFEDKEVETQTPSEEEISQMVGSVEYKNPFEEIVFQDLGIGDDVEQVLEYSKLIREFIGNPENSEIRDLIVRKEFKKASEIMVEEIRKEKAREMAA